MPTSGYRLGRVLKSSQRDRRDYITYLSSVPGKTGGGAPGPAPVIRYSTIDVTSKIITLNFKEAMRESSLPAPTDFVVKVAGVPVTISAIGILGKAVTVTLAAAAGAGTITLDYTPGAKPLMSQSGTKAAAIVAYVVRP